jgi:hypothetical protein
MKKRVKDIIPVEIPDPGYRAFAYNFVSNGGKIGKAAEAAGFAASYGTVLIQREDVKQEIVLVQERLIKACDLDTQKYYARLSRLVEESEKDGNFQAAASLMALIGKALGHLADRPPEVKRPSLKAALDRAAGRAGLPVPASEPVAVKSEPDINPFADSEPMDDPFLDSEPLINIFD